MNKIAIGLVVAVTLAGLAVAVGLHLASRGTGAHCHSATIAASGPPFHNVCDMSARIERFFNREADLARSEAADRKPGEPAATPLAPPGPTRCVPFAANEISCTETDGTASAGVNIQLIYTYRTRQRAELLTLFSAHTGFRHREWGNTGVVTPQQYGLNSF